MSDATVDQVLPCRRGLPADPVLQLAAGSVTDLGAFAVPALTTVLVARANPMRVALYLLPVEITGTFQMSPFPDPPISLYQYRATNPGPVAWHCRDYPGITQGEWWLTSERADTYRLFEYTLQPWW
jgi:hypothetical protein